METPPNDFAKKAVAPVLVVLAGFCGGWISPIFKALLDRQAAQVSAAPWVWPDSMLAGGMVGSLAGFLGVYLLSDVTAPKLRATALALASGLFWQPVLSGVGGFLPGKRDPLAQDVGRKIDLATEQANLVPQAQTSTAATEESRGPTSTASSVTSQQSEDQLAVAVGKTLAALKAAKAVDDPWLKFQAAETGLSLVGKVPAPTSEPAQSGLRLIKEESEALLRSLGTSPPPT
jgi:hypothetical protein